MCTARGAEALRERALVVLESLSPEERARVRLLRGGCFGLCEMSANVVVRRWARKSSLPDPSVDRLRVTGRANEVIYSRMVPHEVERVLCAHVREDAPADELTLEAREEEVPPTSATARNLRRLRQSWRRRQRQRKPGADGDDASAS